MNASERFLQWEAMRGGRPVETNGLGFFYTDQHGNKNYVREYWGVPSSNGSHALADVQAEINDALESWQPVDLDAVLDSDTEAPVPTILRSKDQRLALFYPGCVNGLHGDSTSGKTWLMLAAMAQELDDGRTVLMIDAEANAAEIVARLRALAVAEAVIAERFLYVAPQTPATDVVIAQVVALIAERQVTLVGIDSAGEMFGLEALDENKDTDVGPWFRRVPRTLAGAGPAVVLNDHATKAGDNPLHPSGSKRKRAAITGASYLVEAIKAPTRTEGRAGSGSRAPRTATATTSAAEW